MIQKRAWKVLLHIRTSNEKIQIPIAHAHFERGNKTARFPVYGRCPIPGGHPSQAAWRWVSTWLGDRRSTARISKR